MLTDCANNGPRISSAPSSSACCAASLAPSAEPPSSFTRSWIFGELNSANAISAALRIAWPATPALPPAESGRMSAMRTWPVPSVDSGTGGPAGAGGDDESDGSEEKPEHPPSTAPVAASRPASQRRRVSMTTNPLTGNSADKAVLLTAFTRRNHRVAPICHSGGESLTKPKRYAIRCERDLRKPSHYGDGDEPSAHEPAGAHRSPEPKL